MVGTLRTTINVSAKAEDVEQGKALILTVKNEKHNFSEDQLKEIEDLCNEDDLVRILESLETIDVSFVISLIMARQNGWPLEFVREGSSAKFIVEVDVLSVGAHSYHDPDQLGDKQRNPALLRIPAAASTTPDGLKEKDSSKRRTSQMDTVAANKKVNELEGSP